MPRGSYALPYSAVSTHTSLEDALLALHSFDAFEHVTAYNYGAYGHGKVYRCISHKDCARRLRIVETTRDEEEIPVTFELAVAGEHGTQATNRKRLGIDMAVKGEVDGLLATGATPKKCRLSLQSKYADQPAMLAKVPDEGQLKNRLLTLRKHGWRSPEPGTTGTGAGTSTLVSTPARRATRKRRERVESSNESSASDGDTEDAASSTVEDGSSSERHAEITDSDERLDKEKLMEEFAALPGRPVFWSLLKKTRFIQDKSDETVTEWITGQVVGWQATDGQPTKWMVRFTDGEKRGFELEELVDEIASAAQLGLNVTGRPLDC
ncbi:PHOsphatase [Phytophthora pseudosyringae]|uniref:PHOsphatase n=1 Tax=Phytophthora pseudosyringae TaxID=221518 RepID=A0A8T1WA41_9STRA|nr:PHOsphatase [Phytophthora pseudosyringae]